MARFRLKPPLGLSILALFLGVLVSLHLMSSATQDASQLGAMYSWLVVVNLLGSVLLLGLVIANAYSLFRQWKRKAAGSNLTTRMVFLFSLLSLAPAAIVFYYSMQFLEQSIDSWFDVRIDHAMEDALQLGQTALDERMRAMLKQTEQTAEQLADSPPSLLAIRLGELRDSLEEGDFTVFSRQGRILAFSGFQSEQIIPDLPEIGILLQVKQGKAYVGLEAQPGGEGSQIRAVVGMAGEDTLFLQAVYPVPSKLARLTGTVESAYLHYKELTFLRGSLKLTFGLTLSLVLLLSLLAALWAAFQSIRRIVAPVRYLAHGTRAVAEGNYEKRLPVRRRDELGFLVESFNAMTEKIGQARDEAQRSRQEVERQRAYLETLLASLSSGVLSFDASLRLLTANGAADAILHAELGRYIGEPTAALTAAHPHLADLLDGIAGRLRTAAGAWQEEIPFAGLEGRQELFCRGTPLFGAGGERLGSVLVIDDVTALIQAQRAAAWSEVARRLAHEIKNPLTPIQLSAERLRHKLAKHLDEADAEVLDRATRTIVQQVEAMKTMVNAFAEYAKPSIIQLQWVDLDALIEAVVALYPPQSGLEFELALAHNLPEVHIDPVKLRQVLHNLIKNSQEAVPVGGSGRMRIQTQSVAEGHHPVVELRLYDAGPGIPADQADRIFEPYVTTKAKGTGLGLAIVRKIIEEHGGGIKLDTGYRDGAGFVIRLPVVARTAAASAEA
ncbi:Signal transduction histidine kinase involved in nitrogen fixation and metabolism regulation [Methylomagnum ishizawai]|uniref:histidine kinase n=1 Tax=Methylomagnum ishizawai TaxID=1760988 RepID=A0A1Y6D0Q8_9GAMM|nr:ATP-binding protein [Methylomagnum ishizawai]SMF94142.1 Signal transduction histidine kinase involved in nitrogen fixation and metabolism regulation [Methylomagnum ishizawai]